MPRLADLQRQFSRFSQAIDTPQDSKADEELVVDERNRLTPAEIVEKKFWALLATMSQQTESK